MKNATNFDLNLAIEMAILDAVIFLKGKGYSDSKAQSIIKANPEMVASRAKQYIQA